MLKVDRHPWLTSLRPFQDVDTVTLGKEEKQFTAARQNGTQHELPHLGVFPVRTAHRRAASNGSYMYT